MCSGGAALLKKLRRTFSVISLNSLRKIYYEREAGLEPAVINRFTKVSEPRYRWCLPMEVIERSEMKKLSAAG